MKTITLLSIAFFFVLSSYSQTREIEIKYIKDKFEKGEITIQEYQDMGKKWNELMDLFKGYPKFPYNPVTEEIEYLFTKNYPTLTKEIIYDRIKEWTALSFGNINSVLHYENYENGKIIIKGTKTLYVLEDYERTGFWGNRTEVETIKEVEVAVTYVFTIRDTRLKVQYAKLNFEYKSTGYYSNLLKQYIPNRKWTTPLYRIYPITSGDASSWKYKLSILYETTKSTSSTVNSLTKYIENYENDYSF